LAHAAFKEKKAKLANRNQKNVLQKYGNASAGKMDDDLLLPSSEAYVEYDRKYVSHMLPTVPVLTLASICCSTLVKLMHHDALDCMW
jgi:hypothetical protein